MFNAKQKGLSPLGVLLVVCVFAFFMILILKLAPYYIDYNSIKTVFSDAARAPETKNYSNAQIQSAISKRLTINSVRDFRFQDSAYISRDEGNAVLGFEYEIREHMFANIDVVLSFSYETEIK